MPSRTPEGKQRGYVIPIGGAEDRVHDRKILEKFVRLAGEAAHIAVIPTASMLDETGPEYKELFKSLGAKATVLPIRTREDAEAEKTLAVLESCTAVFITGGNQLRLSTTLGGTSAAKILRRPRLPGRSLS